MKKLILSLGLTFAVAACSSEQFKEDGASQAKAKVAAKTLPAENTIKSTPAELKTIEWTKALELGASGGTFVDVRNPNELEQGFVPGAVNIPLGDLEQRMAELPKDRDLLIYCRSGRRSEAASKILLKNGFERVYNVAGGFLAYPQK